MIIWFRQIMLRDGSLRLNQSNPSKRPTSHQQRPDDTVTRRYTKTVLALIQVFLSPHFSSDASVVSGNSLQKIEKKKKKTICVLCLRCSVRTRFITADHKRQALRRNAPTQWTKARHEGRLNKGACLPDYTDQTGWYLQAYFLTFGINYFQFNQLLSCARKTASTASL